MTTKPVYDPGQRTAEFSRYCCDMCGTTLGGSRYEVFQIFPGTTQEPVELEVCEDCYLDVAGLKEEEEDE